MRRGAVLLILGLTGGFFCGCFNINLPKQEIRETRTFDISRTSSPQFPFRVEILPFRSDSPAKFRRLRRSGSRLIIDEYNKWVQTPSRMLTRCFQAAFQSATQETPAFKLSANILAFEYEEHCSCAVLSTAYTLSLLDGQKPLFSRVLTTRVRASDPSADAFANAMRQAVAGQIAEVKEWILNSVKSGQ